MTVKTITSHELFAEVQRLGIEHSNHESSLCLPVTDETRALIARYDSRRNVSYFSDPMTGKFRYDIPFAYMPWWEQQRRHLASGISDEEIYARQAILWRRSPTVTAVIRWKLFGVLGKPLPAPGTQVLSRNETRPALRAEVGSSIEHCGIPMGIRIAP